MPTPPGPHRQRKHNALIVELRREVPAGLCIYCERPLVGRQRITCARNDLGCLTAYMADYGRQRKADERKPREDQPCARPGCPWTVKPLTAKHRYCSDEECRRLVAKARKKTRKTRVGARSADVRDGGDTGQRQSGATHPRRQQHDRAQGPEATGRPGRVSARFLSIQAGSGVD